MPASSRSSGSHGRTHTPVLLNAGHASHPVRLFAQLMSFYVALSDSVLIALRDATVKRTMPVYKLAYSLTTSRYESSMQTPDFASLSRIEEKLLAARLDAVRLSISHAGEKGRALELQVRKLLRDLLPPEYGLTTGFVVWLSPSGPTLSPQLDIIIYDAIRHSPLIHLESCDVLPLEAVYGYVEVKATLRSTSDAATSPAEDSIEACVHKNSGIRKMRTRVFRVPIAGSPIVIETRKEWWLALRSYIVAFEASGSVANDADAFAGRMAEVLKRQRDAHIHGVLLPNHGFFYTRPVDVSTAADDDYFHVRYTTDHPLLAFKSVLLQGLVTFQRPPTEWAPALDIYFAHEAQWREQVPSRQSEA